MGLLDDALLTTRELYRGKSLVRIQMNIALRGHALRGRVVDVGGGRNPDYFSYLQTAQETSREAIDGSISGINLEEDPLPYAAGEIDTVLLCNVLEHIYHHQFLLKETVRVLRPGGQLIGFVPFWVGYHPDPHDYFRYTKEALGRMLTEAGYTRVTILPLQVSPILACINTLTLSLPRPIRPVLYLASLPFEWWMKWLRPRSLERNPLGFVFTGEHHA